MTALKLKRENLKSKRSINRNNLKENKIMIVFKAQKAEFKMKDE